LYCSLRGSNVRERYVGHVAGKGRGLVYKRFVRGTKDLLEDESVDLRVILRWIFMNLNGGMDWIVLTQNRNRWRSVPNAVMKVNIPENTGKYSTC
jgi:hypothetical protein